MIRISREAMIDFIVISQPLYIPTGMSPKLESTGFTVWKDYNKTALHVVIALQEKAPNIKGQSKTYSPDRGQGTYIVRNYSASALFKLSSAAGSGLDAKQTDRDRLQMDVGHLLHRIQIVPLRSSAHHRLVENKRQRIGKAAFLQYLDTDRQIIEDDSSIVLILRLDEQTWCIGRSWRIPRNDPVL